MLRLEVDAARWREHLDAAMTATPDLVPVVKGNGYGLGRGVLVAESIRLGVDTIAVGTYSEAADVIAAGAYSGNVMVLSPWRPGDVSYDPQIVHTISRVEDVAPVAAAARYPTKVILEGLTSMRRHGVPLASVEDLGAEIANAGGRLLRVVGAALHHPIDRPHQKDEVEHPREAAQARSQATPQPGPVTESAAFLAALSDAGVSVSTAYVSHLEPLELEQLESLADGVDIRPRVGTRLWLGDRTALAPRATVLDVHALRRGDHFGYRQRAASGRGWLVVVGGGTAHGVGLAAPRLPRTARDRAKAVAAGGLGATGHLRSPYRWDGHQLAFAEPPHMQVSMVLVPGRHRPPAIGDELELDVRFTTTTFDEVTFDEVTSA